jgi:hypothetical protein
MIDCVRTGLAAFILWRMNPASTKEDNEKFKSKLSWMETMKQDRASKVAAAAWRSFARCLIG